jgi:hypothetical protein
VHRRARSTCGAPDLYPGQQSVEQPTTGEMNAKL